VQADALFILGDLFEYWVGDDMLGLPFEARCAQALRRHAAAAHPCAARQPRLPARRALLRRDGLPDLADPTVLRAGWGDSLLVTHGDALCIADTAYQQFRAQVRQPAWQAALLARPWKSGWRWPGRCAPPAEMADGPRRAMPMPTLLVRQWLAPRRPADDPRPHPPPRSRHLPGGAVREVLSDWELDQAQPRADMLVWSAEGVRRESLVPLRSE
jgi:UDP-2,3-diacylglucosamine hydrolase